MKSTAMFLAFLTVGLIIGIIISPPIVQQMRDGVFTSWQSLGSPPEPIVRLLGYEFGDRGRILVRVETNSGSLYQCCSQENAEWRKVASSELVYMDPCLDLPPKASAPPRKVVSCVEAATFEWATVRTQFALMDDGSIWTWHYSFGFLPELGITCNSSLIGGLLGIVVIIVMKIIQRQRDKLR